jgi:hypothetical protein
MSDDQTNVRPQAATPAGRRPGSARRTALLAAAVLLPTVCLVAGAAYWLHGDGEKSPTGGTSRESGPDGQALFHGWPTPDFALVLTAQQHGYLLPCGCSNPQKGGLERRYNFVEFLRKERGWPVVAYDLGDVPQKKGPADLPNVQGLIKYRYAMEAMKRIGYAAVSFGEYEASYPLNDAIDEYALNNDKPAVLGTNLQKKAALFPDGGEAHKGPEWGGSYVGSWQVTPVTKDLKVGALGIIDTHNPGAVNALVAKGMLPAGVNIPPSVGGQITALDQKIKFDRADDSLTAAVAAMEAKKPDFRVLLYQGPLELAKVMPKFYPQQFQVIVCLSEEDEPPGAPVVVDGTFIVRLGHKGKNIGVVGVKRTGNAAKPFDLRYQLVTMGEEWMTPKGKDNPIVGLLESYTKELKANDYLKEYEKRKVPHEIQAAIKGIPALAGKETHYIGSEACGKCHKSEYKIWEHTPHAEACQTLVKATNPSLRQYDPECIVCHTVGFRYQTGFANAAATPKLKDVGCESCHGPSSAHANDKNNADIHRLINPWKAQPKETGDQKKARLLRIETMCRKCHDDENDVHWHELGPKWEKIVHPMPEDER